jgi:hypothetical protein
MSISSIPASAPTPITYPDPNATKTPDVNGNADDATTAQPPSPPPLPPGQGTRVDQFV